VGYEPVNEFPPVGPLPAEKEGVVTFGSFNQFRKVNPGVLRCWARLLRAAPSSRLLLVCPREYAWKQTRAFFDAEDAEGVAPERIELVVPGRWPDYIRHLERVDVALDSFPCNGMTTTCHCLWMGIPVVSLSGATAVSRAGHSLLHTVGLPEWVASNEEDYARIAAEAAADFSRLASLRANLRSRLRASPLMDAPRFTRNIEAAYRAMWQRWCAKNPLSLP
jgi:predicted O-linked N-acetylglucosamine transferase (SPINDLY family)